jgi:hypothetical protein
LQKQAKKPPPAPGKKSPPRSHHKKQPAKKPSSKPLPDPVEASAPSPQPADQGAGVLGGIKNLFSKPQSQGPDAPLPNGSATSSTSDGLSSEAHRILDSVPETIGPELGAEPVPGAIGLSIVTETSFEVADVREGIASIFGWMGDHVGEHCRLSDRQLTFVSGPTAQVLNASLGGLKEWMPGFLQRWCESTPGATAFLLAWGIVLTPMGVKQLAVMRERARARAEAGRRVPGPAPVEAPKPAPRQPGVPKINWDPQGKPPQ